MATLTHNFDVDLSINDIRSAYGQHADGLVRCSGTLTENEIQDLRAYTHWLEQEYIALRKVAKSNHAPLDAYIKSIVRAELEEFAESSDLACEVDDLKNWKERVTEG